MKNQLMCVPFSWTPIEKENFEKFGVIDTAEAHPVVAWEVGNQTHKTIVSMYNYGDDKKFMDNIYASVEAVKDDEEFVSQHGMKTVFSEIVKLGGKKTFVLVSEVESLLCVDVFFVSDGVNYNLHTIANKTEITGFEDLKKIGVVASILDIVEGL